MEKRVVSLPYIPEDIIACEILPRLPAKALVRMRCVSKGWRSLILDDPHLARLQLAHGCSSTALISPIQWPQPILISRDHESIGLPKIFRQFVRCYWFRPRIVASCKGILCVEAVTDGITQMLYVGNPVLNDWRPLPFCRTTGLDYRVGLDVCERESGFHYKVVIVGHVSGIYEEYAVAGFAVLSSVRGYSWELSEQKVQLLSRLWPRGGHSINLDGCLFWMHAKQMIWFDTKRQCSGTFMLPPQSISYGCGLAAEWNGNLSFIVIANGEIKIWSRSQSCWSKKTSLAIKTIAEGNFDFFASMGLRMNLRNRKAESLESILEKATVNLVFFAADFIVIKINEKVLCYDTITGTSREIKADIRLYPGSSFPYVNSLLKLADPQIAQ